jgi:pSer/pThr/pTyr-binding forkhead associated (FHA) protein
MSAKITLTVTRGSLKGRTLVFDEPTRLVIGRASDCQLSLLQEPGNADVSRHHCVLDIDPPEARVRDLGSLNGTYVNGQKIGQRPRHLPPEAFRPDHTETHPLQPGDEIQVGGVTFSVGLIGSAEAWSKTFSLS